MPKPQDLGLHLFPPHDLPPLTTPPPPIRHLSPPGHLRLCERISPRDDRRSNERSNERDHLDLQDAHGAVIGFPVAHLGAVWNGVWEPTKMG